MKLCDSLTKSITVDNDESDEEPTPPMSVQQGKAALEDAFRYCEEQFEEDMDASFMAKLRMSVQEEKKQLTLDTCFIILIFNNT